MSRASASTDSDRSGLWGTLLHADFTKLWIGQVVSSTGDRFYQFALLHLAMGASVGLLGSFGRDAARVIFCGMILPVLLSRWIGHRVDRWDRKKIIFWTEAGRGLIALGMLAGWAAGFRLPFLLAMVALSGLLTGLFIPARQSALPMLVPSNHLVRANALMTFAGIAADLVGASGGLAVALVGESFSFVAAAAGFAFSAVMVYRIRTPLAAEKETAEQAHVADRELYANRATVRILVWLTVAFTFVTGLFLPFFAEHVAVNIDCSWLTQWISQTTDATFAGLVVLLGVGGAGLFAGMITAGQLPRLAHWRLLPFLMLAVWGGAVWKLGDTTAYLPAAICCFLTGWATGLITIPSDARLQHEVAGERHGRIFARRLALSNIAFLLGLALNLDGRFLHAYGAEYLLARLGMLAIAVAAAFWIYGGKTLLGSWGLPPFASNSTAAVTPR
ncbi:MAG TPA: MFS transporter [Opitutaceae bacterium]|nr:MFS transporter [Opitutaceae bacterium]